MGQSLSVRQEVWLSVVVVTEEDVRNTVLGVAAVDTNRTIGSNRGLLVVSVKTFVTELLVEIISGLVCDWVCVWVNTTHWTAFNITNV
jgi:hypothetical protein